MADYSRRLKQVLLEHECRFDRSGEGDHEIWFSPITKIKFVVDSSIKSRHTANAVLKQAGLPKQFYFLSYPPLAEIIGIRSQHSNGRNSGMMEKKNRNNGIMEHWKTLLQGAGCEL